MKDFEETCFVLPVTLIDASVGANNVKADLV